MTSRFIAPRRHIERGTHEAHGVLTARELAHQIDTGNRLDADFARNQRFIPSESIEVFLPKPLAHTAEQQMNHLILNGPTNQVGMISRDVRMSQQSRITHVRFMASGFVTAGTIVPLIRIYEADASSGLSIAYQFDDLELNTILDEYGFQTASKSVFFDWPGAPQVAREERWRMFLTTDAAYAPTSNDYKAVVSFSYDQWLELSMHRVEE